MAWLFPRVNDHPFPANLGQALQTTANEIHFRWDGLSHWLGKGLTFWWFDANWAFSIPPPNTVYGGSGDGNDWDRAGYRLRNRHNRRRRDGSGRLRNRHKRRRRDDAC